LLRTTASFSLYYSADPRHLHSCPTRRSSDLTIRFTLAEMATELEASRLLLWRAAAALDAKEPDHVELCAMAKLFVTDRCFDIADRSLQLFGGYGYLSEYGIEKIVRDLRVHRI